MEFNSLSEIIAMGGHGPYVWTSYAVYCLVFAYLLWQPIRRYRNTLKRLAQQEALAQHRSKNDSSGADPSIS